MTVEERKLKGVNFRGTIAALERKHGKDVVTRTLARLQGEAGVAMRDGAVLTGGWYPAAWYAALLQAIVDETKGTENLALELSKDAVRNDMETLFRILSLFVSPQFALHNAVKVLRRYVDGGTVEVVEARQGHMHFKFTEFHGYGRLMWLDMIGGMEAVLESMRLRGVRSRVIAGGRNGDSHLEVVNEWTP